jgi:deoxycytidylate deaminase
MSDQSEPTTSKSNAPELPITAHPLHSISPPELVFGLVGPLGVDLDLVTSVLSKELTDLGYNSAVIRLSGFIKSVAGLDAALSDHPEDKRIETHMKAGTEIRTKTRWPDILSLFAIARIREERQLRTRDPNTPAPNTAYILRSLKHQAEIQTLRDVYGDGFVTISVYAPKMVRREALAKQIAKSRRVTNHNDWLPRAEELINVDEEEEGQEFGQNVSRAFPLADVFVEATSRANLKRSMGRFIRIFFGNQFLTPTKTEFGMFLASAAAIRSSDLSRQVGAAIMTDEGDLIALGCNEVPKAHGGMYWSDDNGVDGRDFEQGSDPSATAKEEILAETLSALDGNHLLCAEYTEHVDKLVEDLLEGKYRPALRNAQITNLLEFGRIVHAEMAAITDAARRGIAIRDATLFCTTFPCHMCARLIIASGLKAVVFIEPYPKSKTADLYFDSVEVDELVDNPSKVSFKPFVGVAPTRYIPFFRILKRKDDRGTVIEWEKGNATPRMRRFIPAYLSLEQSLLSVFPERIREVGLDLR